MNTNHAAPTACRHIAPFRPVAWLCSDGRARNSIPQWTPFAVMRYAHRQASPTSGLRSCQAQPDLAESLEDTT